MLLTNDFRDDAFGAQFQSILWSILYAEVNGHTFFYSPIRHMNNAAENEKEYIEQAEKCMNLRNKYKNVFTAYSEKDHIIYALRAPLFFYEIENNMEKYHQTETFAKLQSYYFENKESPFDKTHIHIAVHIRKKMHFDVNDNGYRDDTYYIERMRALQNILKKEERPLLFHIYSIGKQEDFAAFAEFPLQFHLEEDTFQSFIGLTFADILILAPSSFSYTAALLTKGTVVYTKFWHPPRQHWLVTRYV